MFNLINNLNISFFCSYDRYGDTSPSLTEEPPRLVAAHSNQTHLFTLYINMLK